MLIDEEKGVFNDMPVLPKTINFYMDSWLENAGIIGLTRILDVEDYEINDDQLIVKTTVFKTINNSFFQYFINTYGQYTHYYKIISWLPKIIAIEKLGFDKYTFQDYQACVKWFNNNVRYFIKTSSYKQMRPLAHSEIPIEEYLENATNLFKKLSKNKWQDKNVNLKKELTVLFGELKKIVQYFANDTNKRYFLAKSLGYRYINKGWNGISFLNNQSKIVNLYQDYQEYFVQPVIDFLSENHEKAKIKCTTCGRKMRSNEKIGYSFLNGMGYDYRKRNSNGYKFNSDQFLCPICRLMYSAVPAGFTYILKGNHGFFVNQTGYNLNNLYNANNNFLEVLTESFEGANKVSPWYGFYEVFKKEFNKSKQNMFVNVQIVNRKNEQYHFNIISEVAANVLRKAEKQRSDEQKKITVLDTLNNAFIFEYQGVESFIIFDEVIMRILNQTNMNNLVNKLLFLKILNRRGVYITPIQILNIVELNTMLFNEMDVTKLDIKKLSKVYGNGKNFAQKYKLNPDKEKILIYQLLQALKIQNQKKTMNLLLSCYLRQQESIPNEFMQHLENKEEFKQLVYSFITGLISGKKEVKVDEK